MTSPFEREMEKTGAPSDPEGAQCKNCNALLKNSEVDMQLPNQEQ